MMKKGVVIALAAALVVAALTACYWCVGAKTREALAERIETINQGGLLSLSVEYYRQGLFTSEAVLKASLIGLERNRQTAAGQAAPAGGAVFDVRLKAAHGPLPMAGGVFKPALAVIELRPAARPDSTEEVRAFFDAFAPEQGIVGSVVIGFDGGGVFEQKIPAVRRTIAGDKPADLDWKGLTARGAFAPDFSAVKGEARSEGVDIKDSEASVAVRGGSATFDLRQVEDGFFIGETAWSLKSFGMTLPAKDKPGNTGFEMRDFTTKSSAVLVGDLLKIETNLGVGSMTASSYGFGPIELNYVARNIDKGAVATWNREMNALQAQVASMTPEQIQAAIKAAATKMLPGLLARSPEFEVTAMRAKTPDGDVDGRFKLTVVNPDGQAVSNPLQILGMLQAEANLNVAETLARKLALQSVGKGETPPDPEMAAFAQSLADEQLDELVGNGLMVKEGGFCRSSASWKDGKLVLNGRVMPLF